MLGNMSNRTVFLSRYVGLFELIVAVAMFAHQSDFVEAVTALLRDRPLLFLASVITVAVGLALVLAHNRWSDGAPALVVTLIGWMTLIKGVLLLLLPPAAALTLFVSELHYERFYYFYAALALALGIYLTAAGFRAASR